jgi:hypothetical protein
MNRGIRVPLEQNYTSLLIQLFFSLSVVPLITSLQKQFLYVSSLLAFPVMIWGWKSLYLVEEAALVFMLIISFICTLGGRSAADVKFSLPHKFD